MKRENKNRSGVIHVACAADSHFLPHCATMLHSLLSQHPDAQIHFLCGPETDSNTLTPLAQMVSRLGGVFRRHEIPAQWIARLPRMRNIPALMWYRIYLPQLLPEQKRVLYLDADTLVVDKLDALWATPLDEHSLAAVSNVLPAGSRDWPLELGMDEPRDYFNSGVLLLNLEALRAQDMSARLAAFGRAPEQHLRWPDQDAFNALLWQRRRHLHPRWNCQNSFYFWPQSHPMFPAGQVREALSSPAILHFEGTHLAKPWHYLNGHPLRRLYFEHRIQTPWPRVELEGRKLVFVLLRPLPTRWTIAVFKLFYSLRQKLRSRRP